MTLIDKKIEAILEYQVKKRVIADKLNPKFKLFGENDSRFLTIDEIRTGLDKIECEFYPKSVFNRHNCLHCSMYIGEDEIGEEDIDCHNRCKFETCFTGDCFFTQWQNGVSFEPNKLFLELEKIGEELYSVLNWGV